MSNLYIALAIVYFQPLSLFKMIHCRQLNRSNICIQDRFKYSKELLLVHEVIQSLIFIFHLCQVKFNTCLAIHINIFQGLKWTHGINMVYIFSPLDGRSFKPCLFHCNDMGPSIVIVSVITYITHIIFGWLINLARFCLLYYTTHLNEFVFIL